MKNQTDIIVSVVAILLALILAGVFMGTARQVTKPAPPEKVIVSAPQYPAGSVTYTNSIPGASGGGGGGLGGGRGAGGRASMPAQGGGGGQAAPVPGYQGGPIEGIGPSAAG